MFATSSWPALLGRRGSAMQSRSIISQLHIAVRNPTALLLGGACGALVPLGTCHVTHELLHDDIVQLSILLLLVLGGLVFSCLSVYAFARAVFGTWYKALGFVIALAVGEVVQALFEAVLPC